MKAKVKKIKWISFLLGIVLFSMLLWGNGAVTYATEQNTETSSPNREINDDDRDKADADLLYYMKSLEVRYKLDAKVMENLHKVFDSAVYYIAYNEHMTESELMAYVAQTKSNMEATAVKNVSQTTSEFIQVADNWETPTVSYGQEVAIVLPIVNLGTEELNDLVIEPKASNAVTEWPFEPSQTGFIQTEPFIPGNSTYEKAFETRREFTFHFKARSNVMTGYYPLTFAISYTKAGVRCEEPVELTVYVKTIGKPESGYIGGNGQEDKQAKPRIIVTGFETVPEKVYAGDTFTLLIHIQNTSKETTVTNALFDMHAAVEGQDKTNTYAAFLPTSGSSSVYMDKIGANSTADIEIEMSAKADLAQKPYVLEVDMTYDAGAVYDLQDKASVSVPIYQESRFDISIPEVTPNNINVGSQSNVMFSIYNTGKTTLYNVQVAFEAESIETNSAFVGNLQSGATGNVDVMLVGRAQTMDDGVIPIQISYEDEAGNVTKTQKEIQLVVNEAFVEDFDAQNMDYGMEEMPQNGGSIWKIVAIIAGVLLVIGGVIFFMIRKKKKIAKQIEKENLEDIDDIKSDNV